MSLPTNRIHQCSNPQCQRTSPYLKAFIKVDRAHAKADGTLILKCPYLSCSHRDYLVVTADEIKALVLEFNGITFMSVSAMHPSGQTEPPSMEELLAQFTANEGEITTVEDFFGEIQPPAPEP